MRQKTQMSHRGRRGWPKDVQAEAQRLYNQEPQPTWPMMAAELASTLEGRPAPAVTTLRDWERRGVLRKEPQDAPWVLGEMSPADDALVLPVVRFLVQHRLEVIEVGEQLGYRVRRAGPLGLSKRQAEWCVRIRTVDAGLPAEEVLRMADRAIRGDVQGVAVALACEEELYRAAARAGIAGRDRIVTVSAASEDDEDER